MRQRFKGVAKSNDKKIQPLKAKKPKKPKADMNKVVGAHAKRLYVIRAADSKLHVKIKYRKVSGETKTYVVAPYSYRWRKNKNGTRWKALYAYDSDENKIKSFYIRNIKSVSMTEKKFRPKWRIEIGA